MEEKMELILNTKENCFLCLETIVKDGENKLGLKTICRFLRINTTDVLLEGLKEGEGDIDAFNYNLLKDSKCNFLVNLCNPCHSVTGKLSSLIHELEVVHLQVNYYTEVFQKILEKADLTSVATKKTVNSETADARMVEHLRKLAKQKCFARNRRALATISTLPLVRLKRLKNEIGGTWMKKSYAVAPITAAADLEDVDNSGDISHSNNSTECEYSESVGIVNASTSTGVLVDAPLEVVEDGATNITKLGRPEMENSFQVYPTSSGSCDNTLTQLNLSVDHQPCSNSSLLRTDTGDTCRFGDFQLDCVPCRVQTEDDDNFDEDQLASDLWDDLEEGMTFQTKNCNESASATMQQIPEDWEHVTKKRRTDNGLIDDSICSSEPNNLALKINKLHNTKQPPKTKAKKRVPCLHCKKSFHRPQKLRLHMISAHPDQIFLSHKPTHRSDSEFAESCRKIFHLETVGMEFKSGKDAVSRQCVYCPAIRLYKCKQYYLKHLISTHKEIISEKLKSLERESDNPSYPVLEQVEEEDWILCSNQESKEIQILEDPLTCNDWDEGIMFETENCNEDVTNQENIADEGAHIAKKIKVDAGRGQCPKKRTQPKYGVGNRKKFNSRIHVPKLSTSQCVCKHCKKSFHRTHNLKLHMIRVHPEEIFLSYKPIHQSISQFAVSCRKILQRETVGCSNTAKKVVSRQCAYCPEIRRYKDDHLKHLVNAHTKIIGEKIEALENEEAQVGLGHPLLGDSCTDFQTGQVDSSNMQQIPEEEKHFPTKRKIDSGQSPKKRTQPSHVVGKRKKFQSTIPAPKLSRSRFACNHCKQTFHRAHKLRLHMIRVHPEQIFLSYKPVHQSESQFAVSCHEILQRETLGCSNVPKKAVNWKCTYCTEIRRYKDDCLNHLVSTHMEILAEKIKSLEHEESHVRCGDSLSINDWKELPLGQDETENCNKDCTDSDGSRLFNCPEDDNDSYPVVVRGEDEINCRTENLVDTFENLLTGPGVDWNDVQVKGIMIKTEDYSESNSQRLLPLSADTLSIGQFNSCPSTITTSFNSCDTDTKYFGDNRFE